MARVGIDLDGVCYDFGAAFRSWLNFEDSLNLNKMFGVADSFDKWPEPTRWEFYLDWGITEEDFIWCCNLATDAGWLFRRGEPTEDASTQIRRLFSAGHEVVIITDRSFGRPGKAEDNTREWLFEHNIPFDEIHFTADKTTVPVDYMIDDKPANVEAMLDAKVDVFYLDRPWNQGRPGPRFHSLSTYVDYVLSCEAYRSADEPEKVTDTPGEVRTVSSTGGEKGSKPARYDLIPADPLRQVAEHYGRGAEKYEARNWERGYDWSLSFAAMMRHAWQFWNGEDIDAETGSHHMAAVVFHALALIEFGRTHPDFDNRPSKPAEPS